MSGVNKMVKSAKKTAEVAKPEKPVDPKDLQSLQANEEIIAKAQSSYLELGKALMAIREGKQFEAAGFEDFKAYCVKKWSYSENYANRLIAAYECHEFLKKELAVTGEVLPKNEYQYRSLARLHQPHWIKAWKQVLSEAAGKPVTGEMVSEVAEGLMMPESHKAVQKHKATKTKKPLEAKKLVEIGKLVSKALKSKSKLSQVELIQLLEKIRELVA